MGDTGLASDRHRACRLKEPMITYSERSDRCEFDLAGRFLFVKIIRREKRN